MKQLAKVYALIFGFLLVYFFWQGWNDNVWEGDSLAYHIPIAQNITQGKFANFENENNPFNSLLQYYPASSHFLLALFLLTGKPQLFNVIGWISLFFSSVWLGKRARLKAAASIVFGVMVSTLTPAIRLITTQTIDIWMLVWYCLSLGFLLQPLKKTKEYILAGVCVGMLVGTKFTGPLFLIGLLVIFIVNNKSGIMVKSFSYFTLMVIMFGLPWYIRNMIFRGDIFYPSSHPIFTLDEIYNWQTILFDKSEMVRFAYSLISEYIIWVPGLIITPILLFKQKTNFMFKTVGFLIVYNFIVHLVIPAAPMNMLSDLRYALPTFTCVILGAFIWAQEKSYSEELALVGLLSTVATISLAVEHRPKIFFIYSICIGVLILISRYINYKKLKTFR